MNTTESWDSTFKEGKDFTSFNEIFLDEILIPALNKSDTTKKQLLDVGCGTGDVLFKMMKRGWNVTGIDGSSEAVRIALARTGLGTERILAGDIDQGILDELTGKKFDLITVKLVIAFVKDKKRMISSMKNLLSEHGKLVLISPLIYEGITYTKPNTTGIGVKESELSNILKATFREVDLFHRDFIDDNGVIGYYLCEG